MHKNQAPLSMGREAIDDGGHLGSLYDGYSDCIIGQINMDDRGQVEQRDNCTRCEIICGNTDKTTNFLQSVGLEDDLGLNVLLKIAPRTRMAFIINHPFQINQHTRLIHYSNEYQKRYLPHDVKEVQKLIGSSQPKTTATHIITSIHYGIKALVVVQLSSASISINQIDHALQRLQAMLSDNSGRSSLDLHDESLFQQNTRITVYSNITLLNGMNSIRDICQLIMNRKSNERLFQPIHYTLTPIHLIYPQFIGAGLPFIPLESIYRNKLEQSLTHWLNDLKDLKNSLEDRATQALCEYLREQFLNWKNTEDNRIEQLQQLVLNIRRGRREMSSIDEAITRANQVTFDRMVQDLRDLEVKGQLIIELTQQHFQYCNVVDYSIAKDDNETTIKRKLLSNNPNARILCSTDTLNNRHPEEFQTLREDLIQQREQHSEMQLIYADFSYSSFELKNIFVLPSGKDASDMINILLLGETGVGKSTFINAFANYLTFDTMQQAETNQPVVLIPVSFLITVGDNFDEHTVKFGDVDVSNNEDFQHPGQSVTQHCRSYVFTVDRQHGRKVCIIDTPGFGDTRGIDQDDYNMAHILEYMKDLSYLNAVCFLLKPNEARLNIFFRSCLVQLFSLFGPTIADNILFCFTNSRSTFYAPGDTAPLLKTMLKSLSQSEVPFKKNNTFCFDSESFRYLVALRNNVPFDDLERRDYEASWTNSVTQSNRLVDFIRTKLTTFLIDGNLHSVKHAQLEIHHMIRPMLEAMRNILRNRIIHTVGHSSETIEMHPRAISDSTFICSSCTSKPIQVAHFWIMENIPHKSQGQCCDCSCSRDEHQSIDYVLEYSTNSSKYDHQQMGKFIA